jgi:UDP-GlcNAc:undecaprenyl-phosphate/decaprenyl-phosphate GlcNAc-1-phosphate transferase
VKARRTPRPGLAGRPLTRALTRALTGTLTGTIAAATATAAYAALRARPPGGEKAWTRTNHRGEPVTLLEGPAVAAGAVVAAALAPGTPGRTRAGLALAGTGAAAFGGFDDLADTGGPGGPKGFRGHIAALRRGEVTTGAIKLGGIGVTGLAGAAAQGGSVADVAVNAGLIAGGANLLNLFDLRPGRAIKVAVAAGAALCGTPAGLTSAPAPAAAALALARQDLGERAMLGDAGANALGAMLGAAAAASLSRRARTGLLAAIAGLNAASEVVSFTKVIEKTPPLRRLDMLGRRPAEPPADGPLADGPMAEGPQAGDPLAGGPLRAGEPLAGETSSGKAWSGRSQTSA